MLKHVHATAHDQARRSKGGANLNCSTSSSKCSSPNLFLRTLSGQDFRRSPVYLTPEQPLSLTSRTSSFASLNLAAVGGESKMTPIKIYAKCLQSDIKYKTLSVSHQTTSTEVIWMLLSKCKMRHRDPKLFYLTMEIGIQEATKSNPEIYNEHSRTLYLDDNSRPAELRSCYPKNDCRFTLQMKKASLVRIYDSVLMAESKYKCLLISEQTTVQEVINILFQSYGLKRIKCMDQFAIFEVSSNPMKVSRRLMPNECPAVVQSCWHLPNELKFVLQRHHPSCPLPLSSLSPSPTPTPIPTVVVSKPVELSLSAMSIDSSPCGSSSERSLSSCDECMDDSETSLDTSYNITFCSTSSKISSLATTLEQRVPSKVEPRRQLLPQKLTFNQSVQTSGPPMHFHLSSFPSGTSTPNTPLRRNQMSQTTTINYHEPLAKSGPVHFNLNLPVRDRHGPMYHNYHRPSQLFGYTSSNSIHQSGLPLPLVTPRPRLQPAQSPVSITNQSQSLLTMGAGTRHPIVAFHEYENYFFI